MALFSNDTGPSRYSRTEAVNKYVTSFVETCFGPKMHVYRLEILYLSLRLKLLRLWDCCSVGWDCKIM